MKSTGVALLVVSLIGTAACGPTADEVSSATCHPDASVANAIDSALARHVAGHLAGDPVAAAAIYTPDLWLRWEGGLEVRGRDAAVEIYRELYKQARVVDMAYASDETLVCADAAHQVGHYFMTTEAGGQRATTRDVYTVLWRRQPDGSWLLARGAGSSLKDSTQAR